MSTWNQISSFYTPSTNTSTSQSVRNSEFFEIRTYLPTLFGEHSTITNSANLPGPAKKPQFLV